MLRKFTLEDALRVCRLLPALEDIDAQLADAIARVICRNDESALPLLHDRLNVINRPELADRVRSLLE